MKTPVFIPGDILIPKDIDMQKWSTVACDQFSSQPDYWDDVRAIAGDAPSTLNLMLPEAFLESVDMNQVRRDINSTMDKYLADDIFDTVENSFIYVERAISNGKTRRGLVGLMDLDQYDFSKDSIAPIKASENTVISRLPPRIKMRRDAAIEMPHVMVLIDDPDFTVMGPLSEKKDELECVYDFDLMLSAGHISGYQVTGKDSQAVMDALDKLGDKQSFEKKYSVSGKSVTLMIIGDGNHSLAAAKACWDELKPALSPEELKTHPARYALIELTNVHDESLDIEPIHRVVFETDPEKLIQQLIDSSDNIVRGAKDGYKLTYIYGEERSTLTVSGMTLGQTIGHVQSFLDSFIEENGGVIDYIHGDETLEELLSQPGSVGILMPAVEKSDLFKSVIAGGVFPKKSFSMGNAPDKRHYLECRKIR